MVGISVGLLKLGARSCGALASSSRTLAFSPISFPDTGAPISHPPPLEVPLSIQRPSYAETGIPAAKTRSIPRYTPSEVDGIRSACQLAREVLEYAKGIVVPGLSTAELDRLVHEKIVQAGAYPSPLNYSGFPKSLTTSVNNVVCHGIPDDRPLESTDLINVDVSVYVGGFHGDCSTTVGLPELDSAGIRLLKCAEAALVSGIEAVVVGRRFNAIGKAIDTMVTAEGYQVCREFIGHGIGYEFHTLPDVHPCDIGAINGFLEPKIAPGMIFTIEPAVNEIGRAIRILDDRWTAVTIDGGRSAQFEHTIYVKEDGVPEILTTI